MFHVVLRTTEDSEPDTMCCELCGRTRRVEPQLPYLNQTASFASDHRCGQQPDDAPGQC